MIINNVASTITVLNGPIDAVLLGNSTGEDAEFTDPGVLYIHNATIDRGDGNIYDFGTVTSPIPQQTHTYGFPGVYTLTLTVTDYDGGIDIETLQYIVIYDPSVGFVTGGVWIYSELGAYKPYPTLEGKACFEFVSNYKKGKSTLSGNIEFQFHAADMNFHPDSYERLIITGSKAMFKGNGTINDEGEYKFMITTWDQNSNRDDTFRIKIWY